MGRVPLSSLWLGLALSPAWAGAASVPACEVFARELSFALSVERHDVAAFRSHLHPGTVFNAGTGRPQRGADAVTEAWAGLLRGEPVELRWRPQHVDIGGEPDLAASSGPYLIRQEDASGAVSWATGRFSSVWKRMPDGEWYVLFDAGAPPRAIGEEEAKTVFTALPERCPYAAP